MKHPFWEKLWKRLRCLLFGTTYYIVHKGGAVVKVRGVRIMQYCSTQIHAYDPKSTERRLVGIEHMALFWGLVFLKHQVKLSETEYFTTDKPKKP